MHRDGSLIPRGLTRGFYDLEQVNVMLEVVKRLPLLAQRMYHFRQAVRPQPSRIERFELLPAGRAVPPNLEAPRVPVVTEEVRSAFGAIELERLTPISLDTVTRDHRRQRPILMSHQDV